MTDERSRHALLRLLYLTQRFRWSAGLLSAGCVKLEPGESAWGYQGRLIFATIPEEVWKQSVIEYEDLLELIVCTEEFDARLLEQPPLDMPRLSAKPKALPGRDQDVSRDGTLNRIMQKIQTDRIRSKKSSEREAEVIDDRQATEGLVHDGPAAADDARACQRSARRGDEQRGQAEGHPSLKPRPGYRPPPSRLATSARSRSPGYFTTTPSVCQPLTFTASRGSEPG